MNKRNNKQFFVYDKLLNAWNSHMRFVVSYGGRGSGKSLQEAFLTITYAINKPGSKILCVRGTQRVMSESSLQTLKDVIDMIGYNDYFEITENTLRCKNGSTFLFYGARNYLSFKSLQGINLCWVDEATELSHEAWRVLIPTIREKNSRFLVAFNPEYDTDWAYENFIIKPRPNAKIVKMNWSENPFFNDTSLPEELAYDKSVSESLYQHVWEGNLRLNNENAIFDEEDINRLSPDEEANILLKGLDRVFEKVVIALDPSGSAHVNSDACGIVVCAKYAGQDRFAVLEDRTKIMKPDTWAEIAVQLYKKYEANKIIYETNYGGDMVESVIKSKDRFINPVGVRATKSKKLRAEPIQALYRQHRVDHFTGLGSLELEMMTYDENDPKQKSPNRLDAMVWALTYLHQNYSKVGVPDISLY
jgi:PBSX family phage terminase large subunit